MHTAQDARAATDRRLAIVMHYGDQAAAYIYDQLASDIVAEADSGGDSLVRQGLAQHLHHPVVDALTYLGYDVTIVGGDLHVSW